MIAGISTDTDRHLSERVAAGKLLDAIVDCVLWKLNNILDS